MASPLFQRANGTFAIPCFMVLVQLALAFQTGEVDFYPDDITQLLRKEVMGSIPHFPRLGLLCFMLSRQTSDDTPNKLFVVADTDGAVGMNDLIVPGGHAAGGLMLTWIPVR